MIIIVMMFNAHTYRTWRGKILANHAGKSYWGGNIWQANNSQCIWHIHFLCICEHWLVKLWRMAHDSPSPPNFLYQNFPVYGTLLIAVVDFVCKPSDIFSSSFFSKPDN